MTLPITLFVDSAERTAAERWLATGAVWGLTSNPTILRKAGARLADVPAIDQWARAAGAQEVCFQTWGNSAEEWYANAMRLREVAPEAIVKVPCAEAGASVITRLHRHGVPTLLTAVYAAKQALIGSALGVKYIAPYYHRMLVQGRDALAECARMADALPQDGSGPILLAASLKSARDVVALTGVGLRAFTAAPEVLEDLVADQLTAGAVDVFEQHMAELL